MRSKSARLNNASPTWEMLPMPLYAPQSEWRGMWHWAKVTRSYMGCWGRILERSLPCSLLSCCQLYNILAQSFALTDIGGVRMKYLAVLFCLQQFCQENLYMQLFLDSGITQVQTMYMWPHSKRRNVSCRITITPYYWCLCQLNSFVVAMRLNHDQNWQ